MVTQKKKKILSKAHVKSAQNMQIAWQNKDIISKIFAENFGSRSLDAYGISLPRIVNLLPTNLPAIIANELQIWAQLKSKVESGEQLSETEIMWFIIFPLACRKKEKKKEALRKAIELAQNIRDEKTARFIISGLTVFCDKIIDRESKEEVRRWIEMTQIGRLFEEEKKKAVKEKDDELLKTKGKLIQTEDKLTQTEDKLYHTENKLSQVEAKLLEYERMYGALPV